MKKDKIIYLSFQETKDLAQNMRIKNSSEWFKWARSSTKPQSIPSSPHWVYRDEWTTWYDFLGKRNKQFLSYGEAQKIAINNKITNKEQWVKFIKNNKKYNLPASPDQVYKNKGWANWMVFVNKYRRMEKYHINHNYFKTWPGDMSYILGFWWSDGGMFNNTFNISQHIKDKDLLADVFNKMGSDYPLSLTDNLARITISSPKICMDIKKIGGCPNKSLIIKMPIMPKKYLPDFVRGYFDGDGSIYLDKTSKRYRSDFTSGSRVFIYGLQRTLRKQISFFGSYIRKVVLPNGYKIKGRIVNKETTYYTLCMGTNDTIRLRNFMYPSDDKKYLKLKRKYDRFLLAGEINLIFNKYRKIWSFKKAKKYVRKLGLKRQEDWVKFCRSGKKPIQIPASPGNFYRNNGWKGYINFLDTDEDEFLSYRKASQYVKGHKIKNSTEWWKICSEGNRPKNIPYEPNEAYKNKGWIDWEHFCGVNYMGRNDWRDTIKKQ